MFQFTLDDLKRTLSHLTPEVRRSLYGLYKHKEYENLGNYLVKNSLGYIEENKVYLNYPFDKVELVNRQLKQLVKCQNIIVIILIQEKRLVSNSPFALHNLSIEEWVATLKELTDKLNTYYKHYAVDINLVIFELDKLIKFHRAANSIMSYCEECRVYKVKVDLPNKIAETKGLPKAIREHLISLI
jgi:hypothetical protein